MVIYGDERGLVERLLTPKQLSEFLQVDLSTVYLWTSTKFIPHFKLGRSVRFREKDVHHWLEDRYNKGRASLRLDVPEL